MLRAALFLALAAIALVLDPREIHDVDSRGAA